MRWESCCDGLPQRIRFGITRITILAAMVTFTNRVTKAFPFKTMPISTFSVVTLSAPLRANLVTKAELWPYGSLYRWNQSTEPLSKLLTGWPLPRLPRWIDRVNFHSTKESWKLCGLVSIEGGRMVMRDGQKRLRSNTASGILSVQLAARKS